MTEEQWLRESANPQSMAGRAGTLRLARTKSGRRSLRLFACACCRFVWADLPDDRLRDAVDTAERFAEGLVSKQALAATHAAIRVLASDSGPFGRSARQVRVAIDMAIAATHARASDAAFSMTATSLPMGGALPRAAALACLCDLFRCMCGNPFRPVAAQRSWRSPTVLRLAQGIYESRTFDDLPILGDALEDAGCTDTALLAHCRGDGPHARGCWAVDLAMGKS